MPLPADFQQRLDGLRSLYLQDLPGKLNELEQAFIDAGNHFESLLVAQRMAHSLAGSGGTFGVLNVSTACRKIELTILHFREEEKPLSDHDRGEILIQIQSLKQSISETTASNPLSAARSSANLAAENTVRKNIALVEEDPQLVSDLSTQLGYFGYKVHAYPSPQAFAEQGPPPDNEAILCDVGFRLPPLPNYPAGAGGQTIPQIQNDAPLLFPSSRDDLQARLEALRAGGVAYLSKPIDITQLVTSLDDHTRSAGKAPIRVLIVDDSAELSRYYADILTNAGMQARSVTRPDELLATLSDFRPDLILMDMYMPNCSGVELTRIIRQMEAYVGVPIVYLSGERDIDLQLEAMTSGADDFLQKPIRPEHLITSIRARTARHGHLRSFIMKDSLTNLLNHSRLREALDIELSRATRSGRPVAFAMIDLDHFKNINDQFGHPAGDQVLRALARMLNQRLRKTDISGRYGGEEFGVVLADTNAETAHRVIDLLREDFAQIRHQSGRREFKVSFSAGIAAFPNVKGVEALSRAADVALYEAKRKGRNRVEILIAPGQ